MTQAVTICVPVRNEARLLPGFLASIAGADLPGESRVRLCVLLDGCKDASAVIVREAREAFPFDVVIRERSGGRIPNAGDARRAAMAMGRDLTGDAAGFLLSCDADGAVDPRWILDCLAALEHAEIVCGRVARHPGIVSPAQDRLEAYLDTLHGLRRTIDPVPWEASVTHHQTSAANMGIRTTTYARLGGFQAIPHGEDARFVDDAERAGFRVRRDGTPLVHTSPRRLGRAPGGFAATMRALDGGAMPIVAHPADAVWQYRMQAAARHAFAAGMPEAVAAQLRLSEAHLVGVARDCPNAQAFAMRVVPVPPGGMRHIPLDRAETVISALGDVPRLAVA